LLHFLVGHWLALFVIFYSVNRKPVNITALFRYAILFTMNVYVSGVKFPYEKVISFPLLILLLYLLNLKPPLIK
jgi:hypothetical protein